MATAWQIDWEHRPPEEAALYNPAFCGELLARSVKAYCSSIDRCFPLPLAFVILPLALPPGTRRALPGKSNTTFETWAAQHEVLLSEIPSTVLALRPVTREALLFLTQHKALAISPRGLALGETPLRLSSKRASTSTEVEEMQRTARLLGRWFANQANPNSILLAMGVQP
jgi:hypothetical protein